jgi:transcriptional regulator with XRE-family HTH domain
MALGKRVKQARLAAQLTQDQLAVLVNMTQGAINAMETRDNQSSRKSLDLANALGVSHTWLITGQTDDKTDTLKNRSDPNLISKIIQVSGKIEMLNSNDQKICFTEIQTPTHCVPVFCATAKTVVYQIVGSTMQRPFRDGWMVACDETRQPIEGEYLLIEHQDSTWSIGEYLFARATSIEIDCLNDVGRVSIQRITIKKIYPITAIIAPSQSKPI